MATIVFEPNCQPKMIMMRFGGFVRVTTARSRMAQLAQTQAGLGRESAPSGQSRRTSLFVNFAGYEMTLLIEMVVDLSVN